MPSGPKKRKAAKKRKEKEAHNNDSASININNPQVTVGNEDPKSQDERESEGSEVASPLSQDHRKDNNQQHHFAEESENRATGEVERSSVGLVDDGKVEKEPKSMKNAERNGVDFKHAESVKEPLDGNERSSSSSSSSSDDESQAFARKQEKAHISVSNVTSHSNEEMTVDNVSKGVTQICVEGEPVKEANGNSDVDSSPEVNFDTPVMSMSEVVKPLIENVKVESSEFTEVAESASTENMDKMLHVSNEITRVPLGLLSKKSEDKLTLDEDVGESSNVSATAVNGNEAKTSNISIVHTAQTSTDAKDFRDSQLSVGTSNGNGGKMLTTSGVCAADTNNDVQNAEESETFERTETQPLVDSATRVTQRTSWMSCCGLFEVFTGSSK
uniref:Uncharacterized protein n=1 Tax=Rhizophora mucronata TaxID=61149 RepID=A0A2P2KSN2_RHIMU